jgi:hypothetical protein
MTHLCIVAGVASKTTVIAVAELVDFSAARQSAVMTVVVPKPSKPAANAARSSTARPSATRPTSHSASSLTPASLDRKKEMRHPLAVRVSKSPGYDSPASLIQALQGSSHACLIVGRSQNLELSGNYSIKGPAVITKCDGRLVAEVGICRVASILSQCLSAAQMFAEAYLMEVFGWYLSVFVVCIALLPSGA